MPHLAPRFSTAATSQRPQTRHDACLRWTPPSRSAAWYSRRLRSSAARPTVRFRSHRRRCEVVPGTTGFSARSSSPTLRLDDGTTLHASGDPEPAVRLMTSTEGQLIYSSSGALLGCNPLLDPLWSDARFREAMRKLDVPPCPLARPLPLPARSARVR